MVLGVDGPAQTLRQLFGIQPPAKEIGLCDSQTSDSALPDYDVVITLTYDDTPDCAEAVESARDALQTGIEEALGDAGLGGVDGDLIGAGELKIYIDGPDPDATLASIRQFLFAHPPLVPKNAILRRSNGAEVVTF